MCDNVKIGRGVRVTLGFSVCVVQGMAINRSAVYECAANRLRDEILHNAEKLRLIDPSIEANFCAPYRQFSRGYVVCTLDSDAAFQLNFVNQSIMLNNHGLDILIQEVSKHHISRPTRRDIQRSLVELYVLHEARHISQGFWDFEGVQRIKENGGFYAIGLLDLIADVDAARVLAVLQMTRQGVTERECFLLNLRNNLFLLGEIALKAFGAPLAKPHKIQRALGIACVVARIDHELKYYGLIPQHTLAPDGIIWPVFSRSGSLTILALTPELKVLCCNVWVDRLLFEELAEKIDEWEFAKSIKMMSDILVNAKLI